MKNYAENNILPFKSMHKNSINLLYIIPQFEFNSRQFERNNNGLFRTIYDNLRFTQGQKLSSFHRIMSKAKADKYILSCYGEQLAQSFRLRLARLKKLSQQDLINSTFLKITTIPNYDKFYVINRNRSSEVEDLTNFSSLSIASRHSFISSIFQCFGDCLVKLRL